MSALPDLTPWRQRLSHQRWRWLIRGALLITLSGFGALFSAWMALDVLTRLEPDHQAEATRLATQVTDVKEAVARLQAEFENAQTVERSRESTQQQAIAFLAPIQAALAVFPTGLGVLGIEREPNTVRWRVQFAHVAALTAFERALHTLGFASAATQVTRQGALMTLTVEWTDD